MFMTATMIVAYGFLLGVGFWASKHLTNKVDELMITLNPWKMKQLAQEI